ncbi:SUKH-4 family immunity protein [Amycolatopsis taiwanensis]|uniref:SUKH-4 family immunity protein n=1 Tax=Amycolatopsis taiwanensis TaxID=342230 RepID=UPI003CCC1F70
MSEVMFHTGLPGHVPGIFTLRLEGRPKAFNVLTASDAEGDLDVLCVGAPSAKSSLRYCVDIDHGHVVLIDLEEESVELINNSISTFLEFLLHIGLFLKSADDQANDQQKNPYFDLLVARLSQVDAFALENAQNWWPTIMDRIHCR